MRPSRRAAEPHPAFSPSNFKRLWIEPNTREETSSFFLSAHHVQKARRSYQRKNPLFYTVCKLPRCERQACMRSTQSLSNGTVPRDKAPVPGCGEGAGQEHAGSCSYCPGTASTRICPGIAPHLRDLQAAPSPTSLSLE